MLNMMTMFCCILMISSSNSLWSMWVGLEVMNFFLIPWLMGDSGKLKGSKIFSYYVLQFLASSIFLIGVISTNKMLTSTMVLLSMVMKMGGFPFHLWVLSIIEGMTWSKLSFFLTWAKSGGLLVLSFIQPEMKMIYPTIGGVLTPFMGLKTPSLRKMLGYSSISHMSWILISLCISSSLTLMYIGFYWPTLLVAMLMFEKYKVSSLNSFFLRKKMWLVKLIIILSLMGFPPFLGFFPKLLVMKSLCLEGWVSTTVFLGVCSIIPFYFYIKMMMATFVSFESKNLSFTKISPSWDLLSLSFILIFFSLDLLMLFTM